ncbi:unnamed protein product [Prunus armeniaca]|uniref:Uncharacterized protein n=1 Tax=Prunus armeniaca TaxID=36596 RepID=A0A6J5X668_PRUAR|nr:unnamed protein product [Prunus armeniaca]CAB4307392.1 unnamed protein product [Prunus armeniaca]
MQSRVGSLVKLRNLLTASRNSLSFPKTLFPTTSLLFPPATYSTICQAQEESVGEYVRDQPKSSEEILKNWGCSDTDISKMFTRRPALRNADLDQLQFKLNILRGLGISASELVKIINCRPRFLSYRINHCFDERLEYFMRLFESREVLVKAIVKNPSLLTYDFHDKIKPAIALYEGMGLSTSDLTQILLSRPTLIPRTSFNDEKMEYIRKTRLSNHSTMYKYVVAIIGISRLETIRQKVANLEKFGLSEDEIFGLWARSPLVLTLSIDKVQRNMTFIIGKMKLPAPVILEYPFFLYTNLEAVLKPRVFLAEKMQEMGLDLQIKGPMMLTALRMTEKRFLKAFVNCHPKDVADELMEFYINAKGVKRLAEDYSKKNFQQGFPF